MNPNEFSGLAERTPDNEAAMQPATASSGDLHVPGEAGASDFAGDPGFDPLAGGDTGRRLNGGIILIAAVILTAVAGLFSMRKLAEVTAGAAIDAEIEATIENFIKSLPGAGPHQATPVVSVNPADNPVLAVITESYAEHQVPLRDVQRDPFVIDELDGRSTEPAVLVDTEDLTAKQARELQRQRDARRKEFEDAGAKLRLKSIMGGSRPMAIVEDMIVHVGDTVTPRASEVVFRVKSILSSSVDLVAEDAALEIEVPITIYLQRDR